MIAESDELSREMSDEFGDRILYFSKLYGVGSEIKINLKISKTGSIGIRGPKILLGVS